MFRWKKCRFQGKFTNNNCCYLNENVYKRKKNTLNKVNSNFNRSTGIFLFYSFFFFI